MCFLDDTKKRSLEPPRGCGTRKTGWREEKGTQLGGAAPTRADAFAMHLSYAEDTLDED